MSSKCVMAAALAVFAAPMAIAQAQIGYGLAAGVSAPLGDFGDAADAGYHLTGLLRLGVPLAPVGLRVEGSFSEFKYTNSSRDAKARLVYGTANVVLSSPGIVAPYVIGGAGIYHASAVCGTCTTTSTKVGYNGGAGLKLGLSGFSAFVEARYHYIPGASDPTNGGVKSSTQFIPVSVGVTF
jgi:hypothetical protein